jgi:hypothetical protein
LKDFFPTPAPLRSVKSNRTLIPKPELDLYRGEADDIANISNRIKILVKAIKANGFYPARFKDSITKLENTDDTELIAVDFADDIRDLGGIDKMFHYKPIAQFEQVAKGLYAQQQNLIQEIYEITGISDIMRNISKEETATATRQKGKFGSLRLQQRQSALNNYIKSIYTIATELVCELFDIDALKEITSMALPTNQELADFQTKQQTVQSQFQSAMQAYQQQMQQAQAQGRQLQIQAPQQPQVAPEVLKYFSNPTWEKLKEYIEDSRLRSYLLDVETNYSVWETDLETQKSRTELFTTITDTIQKASPIIAATPELADIYMKLISFTIDGFKVSRSLKNGIEDALLEIVENIKKKQAQPPQQQPDAQMLLAQAEMKKAEAEGIVAKARMQEAQVKAMQAQAELQLEQAKVNIDTQAKQADIQLKAQKNQIEAAKPLFPQTI